MPAAREHQHIEWKQSWRDDYLKWVCGFANAEGGMLVIGRNDKGEAVGVRNARKLMVDIPNKVRDVLGIMVAVNLREEDGKELIEVLVEPYPSPVNYKGVRIWITYEGLQRLETWPMPMPALREAILNAVVHKDYASAIPIQISVYPDKLMIWDPGELPPSWTIEKLLGKHASIPFNPDIANVFFRTGMIEAWGRGIERIMEACREAGAPEPEVKYEHTGLWVTFTFQAEPKGDTTQETIQETTQEKILSLLRRRPSITRRELAKQIGISDIGIKYHLEKLKEAGIIRRMGPTKRGHYLEIIPGGAGEKVGEKVGEKLTANQKRILEELIRHPRMAASELADIVGISKRKIEQNIAQLKKMGRLRRIGPAKGGHWEVVQ